MEKNFRWWIKKTLPLSVANFLRKILPEDVYYPGYGHTTLSVSKIQNIVRLLELCLANRCEGEIIECGVFRGGSLVQIGLKVKTSGLRKEIYGVDTFEGHPYESSEDVGLEGKLVHHKGLFSSNQMERVQAALNKHDLKNVTLHKGMVENVLPKLLKNNFCFVHLDMDLYQSTKAALVLLHSRMVPGGVICFDDYGDPEAPGVKKAADEILNPKQITPIVGSKQTGYQAYWTADQALRKKFESGQP